MKRDCGIECDCHARLLPGLHCSYCDPQRHFDGAGISEPKGFLDSLIQQLGIDESLIVQLWAPAPLENRLLPMPLRYA